MTEDKLIKIGKLSTNSSIAQVGLRKKLTEARAEGTLLNDVSKARDRIIIVADDSGSMGLEGMRQLKKAIEGFLSVCSPIDTAVGVTWLNAPSLNLTLIHQLILSMIAPIEATGGTPIFEKLEATLEQSPTRVVLVSDGSPTDGHYNRIADTFDYDYHNTSTKSKQVIDSYIEKKLKIDTVFIGSESNTVAVKEMRSIAEATGGMYIFFKEGESFAKSFKYLAPAYYGMLTSGEIKL